MSLLQVLPRHMNETARGIEALLSPCVHQLQTALLEHELSAALHAEATPVAVLANDVIERAVLNTPVIDVLPSNIAARGRRML